MAYYFIGILVLALDQISKLIVEHRLPMGVPVTVIPGFFNLFYTRNTGGAFGLFSGASTILLVVGIIAVVILVVVFFRSRYRNATIRTSLALLLAGALGNIIDRVRLGYVIDFIQLHISNRFYWPMFNIADTSVVVGAVLILVFVFTHKEKEKGKEAVIKGRDESKERVEEKGEYVD